LWFSKNRIIAKANHRGGIGMKKVAKPVVTTEAGNGKIEQAESVATIVAEPEKPMTPEEKVASQLYIDVVCLRAIIKGVPRFEEILSGIKTGKISLADSGQYFWEFESEKDQQLLREARDYFIKTEIKRRKKISPEEYQAFHNAASDKEVSAMCLARKDQAIIVEIQSGDVSLERAEKLRVIAHSKEVANLCQETEDKLIRIEMRRKISPKRWSVIYRMGSDKIKKQIIEKLLKLAEQEKKKLQNKSLKKSPTKSAK